MQWQTEKFFAARQVRHRHTIQSLCAQRLKLRLLLGREYIAVVRQQPGPPGVGLAQYMQQQHLRVNALHALVVGMEQGLLQGVRCIHLGWLLALMG